jgi:hypothetical protein
MSFLLSVGPHYYPYGGGLDAWGVYPSHADAVAALPTEHPSHTDEWANILDLDTGIVVDEYRRYDDEDVWTPSGQEDEIPRIPVASVVRPCPFRRVRGVLGPQLRL